MENIGQKGNKGKSKKRIFIILGVIAAILAIIIPLTLKNGNGTGQEKNKEYTHQIEEVVEYEGLKIKIYNYQFTSSFCGITASNNAGEILCIVDVSLTNISEKEIALQDDFIFSTQVYSYCLIFDENYKYNSVFKEYTDFLCAYKNIKPLQTINASLCFIVPNVVNTENKSLKIKFSKNKVDADVIHYWILREGEKA